MQIGYKLAPEGFGPHDLIHQAVRAEEAGFDFVEISDHFHPWLDVQGHASFSWTVLGAIAARTERIGLATGVTCPSFRYHPAIVAQAAATMALVSDGRFTLGVGAGERLNEHVIGREFPPVHVRHEVFREALEIIRLLWGGGYQSYEGKHLQLSDARLFDLPETAPAVIVAGSGPASAALAAELGDGIFATEPEARIVQDYRSAGGTGAHYCEVPLAWAPTVEAAAKAAHSTNRWGVTGWKVMSELPNPVNFEAATTTVRVDDIEELFGCGPDVTRHLAVAQQFVDAGFDHVALLNAGPDPDGFFDFFQSELQEPLRGLTPSAS